MRFDDASVRLRGIIETVRAGHVSARALAIADSRTLVRVLFLASGARTGLLAALRTPRTVDELAEVVGATRTDRLRAWLEVGEATGELRCVGDRHRLRGRRARALAAGDPVLLAHYRSVLEYQEGPYAGLLDLLHDAPGDGRDDLERWSITIAEVSRVTTPFVRPFLTAITTEARPQRVLDAGCGTGEHLATVLDAAPGAGAVGIDLAPAVAAAAAARLGACARCIAGDVRDWLADNPAERFDLALLLNDVYYFPVAERPALYRRLHDALAPAGRLVVVTMDTPGSIASTHLHFMLVAQAGAAALPRTGEVAADLRRVGFSTVTTTNLVPGEPFVAVSARR